jgi:plasmid stabilization system protein ParE
MSQYILAPLADADISDILLYVLKQSGLAAADRLEEEFHEAMQRIAEAPGTGHSRIDIAGETFRFVTLHKYVIGYLPNTRPVEIARVLHGARDIADILRDRPDTSSP